MFDTQLGLQLFALAEPEVPPCKPARAPKRENDHIKRVRTRAETKAAGGAEYKALLAKERATRAAFRRRNPNYWRAAKKAHRKKYGFPYKTALCSQARARGRKRGLPATIKPEDLIWPTHCPVLGIQLNYPDRTGGKDRGPQSHWPSLDRWDNTKGYVPGNVFVISFRANSLKNSATYDEILKVAKYLSRRPK